MFSRLRTLYAKDRLSSGTHNVLRDARYLAGADPECVRGWLLSLKAELRAIESAMERSNVIPMRKRAR